MILDLIISIIALSVSLISIVALIYLYVRAFKHEKDTNKKFDEVKSKIGFIIRDINTINQIEYENDVNQQMAINELLKKNVVSNPST